MALRWRCRLTWRDGRRWLFLCLAALAAPPDVEAQRPRPLDPTGRKDVTFSPLERNALNHKVFQSRAMQVALARTRQRIEAGNRLQAIQAVQAILDRNSDSVFWENVTVPVTDDDGNTTTVPAVRLGSVRREARLILESLGEDGRLLYERTFGAQSLRLGSEARRGESPAALGDVARRYFATQAGFQAIEQLAARALDRGEPDLAVGLLLTVVDSNVHRPRVSARTVRMAASALQLGGRTAEALALIERAADEFRLTAKSAREIEERVLALRPPADSQRKRPDWLTPFGGVRHNARQHGSAPWLDPLWTVSLEGTRQFTELREWLDERESDELKETGVACYPIVTLGQLVFRDFEGVRGCDPATGQTLWRYNSPLPVEAFVDQLSDLSSNDRVRAELAWAGNPALGVVTSDSERVFAVEYLSFEELKPAVPRATNGRALPRQGQPVYKATCRLVSLRIPPRNGHGNNGKVPVVVPEWSVGGSPAPTNDDPLGGHIFLGPPLPVGGSVYVMTESDLELHLVKLDARTGRTVWIQKLGLVELALYRSRSDGRLGSTCLPAIAGNAILCPTDTGVMVAVDHVLGEILWVYHALEPTRLRGVLRGQTGRRSGFSGMASPPVANRSTVAWLPPQSSRLHCIDLRTGEAAWAVPHTDYLYVAAVTDRYVIAAGRSGLHAHSLQDGTLAWHCRLGIPSGRGARVGSEYLVPLKAGGVAVVNLENGNSSGSTIVPALEERRYERRTIDNKNQSQVTLSAHEADLARFGLVDEHVPDELRPGNLLVHDDLVLSMGPRHVVAFPQAARFLETLAATADPQAKSRSGLLQAQLELATGKTESARVRLQQIVSRDPGTGATSAAEAKRARWILRDLLVNQLQHAPTGREGSAQRRQMLAQLQSLSTTSQEQAEVLVEQGRLSAKEDDWDAAFPAARTVASLNLKSFMVPDRETDSVLSSSAWARDILATAIRKSRTQPTSPVMQQLRRDLGEVSNTDSIPELERFVSMYGTTEAGRRVRIRLADRLIRTGRFQEAELHLLQNRKDGSPESRAVTEVLLAALWDRIGFNVEAAVALETLQNDFAGASIRTIREDRLLSAYDLLDPKKRALFETSQRVNGRQFVESIDPEKLTWLAFVNRRPVDWTIRRVHVTKHPWSAVRPEFTKTWSAGRRLSLRGRSGVHVVRTVNVSQNEWLLIDRFSGAERGRVELPGRLSVRATNRVGHFMTIGTREGMQGVSLLAFDDGHPGWSLRFPPIAASSSKIVEAGPITPSVCVFQTRKHLIGVEPASGRVLWRKSDLDLASGVYVDREAGLFGDEQVTVMFHGDQASYTLLSTQTGRVLRKGKLNVEFRYLRRLFGRHLFHVTRLDPAQPGRKRRIRIWDPLRDVMLLDEEFEGRFYAEANTDRDLLAVLKAGKENGSLTVYAMPQVHKLFEQPLARQEIEGVSALRLMADDERVYINMQRTIVQGVQRRYHYLATDTAVPVDHVQQGVLMAVDRASGRVLWKQPCLQKTYLKLQDCSLPFLVGISRVRPRDSSSIQALQLEVLDRQTGAILGEHNSLFPDRVVHTRIDRNAGLLMLYGLSGRVDLDFSRQSQAIPLESPTL